MPQATLVCGPGAITFGWHAYSPLSLGCSDGWGNSNCHRVGNVVLNDEDVIEVTVVSVGPEMIPRRGVDKLRADTNVVTRFPQTSLKDITHAQFGPDFVRIKNATLIDEG